MSVIMDPVVPAQVPLIVLVYFPKIDAARRWNTRWTRPETEAKAEMGRPGRSHCSPAFLQKTFYETAYFISAAIYKSIRFSK